MAKARATKPAVKETATPVVEIPDDSIFDELNDLTSDPLFAQDHENPDIEDEMMDVKVGATVTDGEYKATLLDIKPIITKYTAEETIIVAGVKSVKQVEKNGKVYNFIWTLADGRQLIDPRFTRDSDDHAKKFQSINIALGNIATQLGKPTLTMRELLTLKPELTVWVSRVGKNRNVDYLKPIIRGNPIAALLNTDNAPF